MKEIGVIKVSDPELFIRINTFECRYGRFTPEFCKVLRERYRRKRFDTDEEMFDVPFECRICSEYEEKWKEVYRKRREFLEKRKRDRNDLVKERLKE